MGRPDHILAMTIPTHSAIRYRFYKLFEIYGFRHRNAECLLIALQLRIVHARLDVDDEVMDDGHEHYWFVVWKAYERCSSIQRPREYVRHGCKEALYRGNIVTFNHTIYHRLPVNEVQMDELRYRTGVELISSTTLADGQNEWFDVSEAEWRRRAAKCAQEDPKKRRRCSWHAGMDLPPGVVVNQDAWTRSPHEDDDYWH